MQLDLVDHEVAAASARGERLLSPYVCCVSRSLSRFFDLCFSILTQVNVLSDHEIILCRRDTLFEYHYIRNIGNGISSQYG